MQNQVAEILGLDVEESWFNQDDSIVNETQRQKTQDSKEFENVKVGISTQQNQHIQNEQQIQTQDSFEVQSFDINPEIQKEKNQDQVDLNTFKGQEQINERKQQKSEHSESNDDFKSCMRPESINKVHSHHSSNSEILGQSEQQIAEYLMQKIATGRTESEEHSNQILHLSDDESADWKKYKEELDEEIHNMDNNLQKIQEKVQMLRDQSEILQSQDLEQLDQDEAEFQLTAHFKILESQQKYQLNSSKKQSNQEK